MAKVYITTQARPFAGERISGAYDSKKKAEKALRKAYPHMRLSNDTGSFACYSADASGNLLLFIHELEVQ